MRKRQQGRSEQGAEAEEVQNTSRPDTARDAIEDLEPSKERADSVKGGGMKFSAAEEEEEVQT